MKTDRAAQSRYGCRMRVQEFGDLYACLDCFFKTYALEKEAVERVLYAVAYAYAAEYGYSDLNAIKKLRNLRGLEEKRSNQPKHMEM